MTVDRLNPYIIYLHHIWNRIHRKEWDFLGCTVGRRRSGKSIFTAYTSWLLWKNFVIERDMVYTAKSFQERVKVIEEEGETKREKYGKVIIFDEAGVGMPAREWYHLQNRELGKMLQTIGHLRPIVFFVTPDISFIDTQARKMFDYFFDVKGRTDKYSKIKPFKLNVNTMTGKIYYRYPRMVNEGVYRMKQINFYMPPNAFIKRYKEYSEPKKTELRNKSRALMDSGRTAKMDMENLLVHIKEQVKEKKNEFQIKEGKFDMDLVRRAFRKDLDFVLPMERERLLKEIVKICTWEDQQPTDKKLVKNVV